MLRRFFSQAWLYFKGQQAAFSFEEFISFQTATATILGMDY